MNWRKAGSVPAKADAAVQQEFLENQLEPRLEEARRGKRAVLFVDAAHLVYGAFLAYLWCLVRVWVPTGNGRQRFSVLGAVDAVTHELHAVYTDGGVNAVTVCELLRNLASLYGGPVTCVLDNARYHHATVVTQLARQLQIELLFLPSYSPNLNLIERLWKFVKAQCLNNQYHIDFKAMKARVLEALEDLRSGKYKEQLATLLTHNFQRFEVVPTAAD